MTKQLFFIPSQHYNETVFSLTKDLTAKSSGVYYVTLNKTSSRVTDSLKEAGADVTKFSFLDALTPHLLTISPKPNCEFIESPENLNLLTERIMVGVKRSKARLLIIDSLSSILVYKQSSDLLKFLSYILPFMEKMQVDVVLFTLMEDVQKPSFDQVKMMVDQSKTLDAGEKKGWFHSILP